MEEKSEIELGLTGREVRAKREISPETLKMLENASNQLREMNNSIKEAMAGPLKGMAEIYKFQEMQRQVMADAAKAARFLDIDQSYFKTITEALKKISPTREPTLFSPVSRNIPHMTPEISREEPLRAIEADRGDNRFIDAMNRLSEATEESNRLAILAEQKKNKLAKKKAALTLILDKEGHLYVKAHPNKLYDLSTSRLPVRIISALTNDCIATTSLVQLSGAKTKDSLYNAIGKINSNAKQRLGLVNDLIVHSPSKGGYCIHADYQILILS